MTSPIKNNKFVLTTLVLTIVLAGMTFGNLPGPETTLGSQTIDNVVYNFADYPSLNHEQIALFNYMRGLITTEEVNSFDNWNAGGYSSLLHYMFAFTDYVLSGYFETIPGYRTDHYLNTAHTLIKKMNTTVAEYGNDSVEYLEWESRGYPDYYWPNATDPSDLFVGGFRGPANIMWTGHYALMQALYERCFNTNEFVDELTWFVEDWNNSLTTDGYGNATEGGVWGTGLIPCEPYIVFAQCNSIPIFTTELYDNMYDTQYMESGMWDYGLNFINTVMHEEYDLFIDGYYVQIPMGSTGSMGSGTVLTVPGPAVSWGFDDGRAAESSYSNAWALTFLEYTQPERSIEDYPVFLEKYSVEVSGEQMYMSGSFNDYGSFGSPNDMLGSFFACALAKQRGDYLTVQRLQNFLTSPYNKVWSADGREMHYDTTSLSAFLQPVMAGFRIWATTPVTIPDLADARPVGFWDYPYISQADDEDIWVYQALWDADNSAFILNIKVDRTATLTLSNFDYAPIAYSGGVPLSELVAAGSSYVLTLNPGTYNLVIL